MRAEATVQRGDPILPTLLEKIAHPSIDHGFVLSAGWDVFGNFVGWVGFHDDQGRRVVPLWRTFATPGRRR